MNYQTFLDNPYEIEGKSIDPIAGTLVWNNEITRIRRKELELLAILASFNGKIVTRDKFIEIIWDGNSLVGDQGLTRAMAYLRKTINDNNPDKPIIRTIPRKGYQLNANINIQHDGDKNFLAVGESIFERPKWILKSIVDKNDFIETWLAESTENNEQRLFRFCVDESHLQRLKKEVNVLRFFRSSLEARKDIISIINWRLDDPPYYLELQTTSHGTIKNWLYTDSGLSASFIQRIRLIQEVATALAAIHAINKPHLNINHNSIYVNQEDDEFKAKLGEFGFSYENEHETTSPDKNIEKKTLNLSFSGIKTDAIYLSPEIKRNEKADSASDIYALGVLLYQCAIGTIPAPIKTNWSEKVKDKALVDLISECIDKDKLNRPSAQEVADQLLKILTHVDILPEPINEKGSINNIKTISSSSSSLQQIDQYFLIEKIGEGGMGEIFLAEERNPVQRKIALKLIKGTVDSEEILARFESERQALAMMNHVNVASIYNFGTTENDRPYFAMEYVAGENIIKFCDDSKLNIDSRLSLFNQICDGVMHAHQKGIIHRDLNPNNILIKRRVNESPLVKIIDFGVAKSLQTKLSTHTLYTQHGLFVGTPQYASPEQMNGNRDMVDTRTDIYSLGIILYELLFGLTPISKSEFSKLTPTELAVKLSKEDVTLPFVRFNKLDQKEQEEISQLRSLTINKMVKELEDEATWIIMKCLEINPDDRYSSIIELKSDLESWSKDLPIKAKKTNFTYHIKKFTKRNRVTVIGSMIFLSLLISMLVFAANGYYQARMSAKETEIIAGFQLDQIQNIDPTYMGIQLHKKVTQLLEDKLEGKSNENAQEDLNYYLNETLNVSDFITVAQSQLEEILFTPSLKVINEEFSNLPSIRIKLLQSLADMSSSLADPKRAFYLQELALQETKMFYGENHINTHLSKIKYAEFLMFDGDLSQAFSLSNIAFNGIVNELGEAHEKTIEANRIRADILSEKEEYKAAETLLLKNLNISLNQLGVNHSLTHDLMISIGYLYTYMRNYDKSKEYFENALETSLLSFGESHSKTISAKRGLGAYYFKTLDYESALEISREIVSVLTLKYGNYHPIIIEINNDIANILMAMGLFEEASDIYSNLMSQSKAMYGNTHSVFYQQSLNYASSIIPFEKYEEADRILKSSTQGMKRLYGNKSLNYLLGREIYAESLQFQKRFEELEPLLNELISTYINLPNEYLSNIYVLKAKLAYLYLETGRYDESEFLYDEVIEYWSQEYGKTNPSAIQSMVAKAGVLFKKNKLKDAEILYKNVIEICGEINDLQYLKYLSMLDLSKILFQENNLEEANYFLNSSLEGLKSILGENNPYTKEAQEYHNEMNNL